LNYCPPFSMESVKLGPRPTFAARPIHPPKRTCRARLVMSQKCQSATSQLVFANDVATSRACSMNSLRDRAIRVLKPVAGPPFSLQGPAIGYDRGGWFFLGYACFSRRLTGPAFIGVVEGTGFPVPEQPSNFGNG